MLSIIIKYLVAKLETFEYLDKVYGLSEIVPIGEETMPGVYSGTELVPVNFDSYSSLVYIQKNGKVGRETEEHPAIACKYQVTERYPFRLIIYSQGRENVNCESYSQQIVDSIKAALNGKQSPLETAANLMSATITFGDTDLDKQAVWATQFSGQSELKDSDILASIEFEVEIIGDDTCFANNPCENSEFVFDLQPQTFCEKVDTCLEIPEENGEYFLAIVDGDKSWISADTKVDNDLYYKLAQSAGHISGGLVTINADQTKFDVAAGHGVIVDNWTNPAVPVVYNVTWNAFTAQTLTYLATNTYTHIYIDRNGAIFQSNVFTTPELRRDYVHLARISHTNFTTIGAIINAPDLYTSPVNQLRDLEEAIGAIGKGNVVSANGANLSIDVSDGSMYLNGVNFHTNAKNPSFVSFNALTAPTFRYRTQTGAGATSNVIEPDNYDNAGTVTAIGSTKSTNQRIYRTAAGNIVVQYGQVVYNSLSEAIAAIPSEQFEVYDNLQEYAVLICILTVQTNCSDLTDTTRCRFTLPFAIGGGGGTSSQDLSQVLATGNTTGGNDLVVSAGDDITLTDATASTPLAVNGSKNIISLTAAIWGAFINGLTGKTTPVDADMLVLADSADSNTAKKLTWANLKATLKAYFDTLYEPVGGGGGVSSAYAIPGMLFGVVRNTAGTWGLINDSSHEPSSAFTISNQSAPVNFRVTYPTTYSEVGTGIFVVDETYAKYGLTVGASVGVGLSDVSIYGNGISAYIAYNGSSWVVTYPTTSLLSGSDITASFSAGVLTVTHTPASMGVDDLGIVAQTRESNYNLEQGGAGATLFVVRFKDYAGNLITTADTQMKFFFVRNGKWFVPNNKLAITNSNIWFQIICKP